MHIYLIPSNILSLITSFSIPIILLFSSFLRQRSNLLQLRRNLANFLYTIITRKISSIRRKNKHLQQQQQLVRNKFIKHTHIYISITESSAATKWQDNSQHYLSFRNPFNPINGQLTSQRLARWRGVGSEGIIPGA